MRLQAAESIILLIVIFFVSFLGYALLHSVPPIIAGMQTFDTTLAGVPIRLMVADEPDEYQQGLRGIKKLPSNQGILFVLDKSARWRASVSGLNFPVDIFWLDEAGRIVHIQKYAPPSSRHVVYTPPVPARYILETNADFADIHNISVGDILRFKK